MKPQGSDVESVHCGTVMLTKGVGTVMVETKVVVWVEVRVKVRGKKTVPKAIPTISATTNRDAITPFLMPLRVAFWGCIVLLTRTGLFVRLPDYLTWMVETGQHRGRHWL